MKKIIAAFDGLKYSKSSETYAIHLAKQTGAHLVGIFLNDPIYTSYRIAQVIKKPNYEKRLKQLNAADKETRKRSAAQFEKACQKAKLEYSIHHDTKISMIQLVHESMYADLLIIDSGETFSHFSEQIPTLFIRELLAEVQCPVLLVPQKFKPFQKLILLFDGAPSSVYAIKMFSYLLQHLKDLDTEVISVNAPEANKHLKDNRLMKEFMKRHFPDAHYTITEGLAEDIIVRQLKNVSANALVVLGAYRRGLVSRWFRESMADVLIKEINLPLFIAHNK